MARATDSAADCPHCEARIDYLRRGCDACEQRVSWEWTEPCSDCGADADYTRERCPACDARLAVWDGVVARVRRRPAHADLRVAKDAVPHPRTAGFVSHTGDPRGQWADFRRPLPDGSGVHVKEYADHFAVHWDRVDPTESFVGHLLADAPHWLLFGGVAAFKLARGPLALAAYIKR